MPSDNQIIFEIASTIIEATGLKNIDLSKVNGQTQLNAPPFNLDSIDILEAVCSIENKYKVRVIDAKSGALHFKNLQTIADFINAKSSE